MPPPPREMLPVAVAVLPVIVLFSTRRVSSNDARLIPPPDPVAALTPVTELFAMVLLRMTRAFGSNPGGGVALASPQKWMPPPPYRGAEATVVFPETVLFSTTSDPLKYM